MQNVLKLEVANNGPISKFYKHRKRTKSLYHNLLVVKTRYRDGYPKTLELVREDQLLDVNINNEFISVWSSELLCEG